jgi:hypothetical protein
MANSPILQILEMQSGQVNLYLVSNDAVAALEAAANDVLAVDLSAGDGIVTNASPDYNMLRYGVFKATGNTVARSLTFSAQKRVFIVHNSGSAALDVIIGATTISVPATTAYRFYADGTVDGLVRVQ